MSSASSSQFRVLVTGATGMIGGLVLRCALEDPDVALVTALGRRPVDLEHPKLQQVRQEDLGDYSAVEDALEGHDVAFFCVGVYTSAVSDAELQRVTVDYPAAFARALYEQSPGAAVCLLSGQGADQSERSRIAFCRYKGAAEKSLLAIGFRRVHLVRPGYIYPVTPRREPNIGYRLARTLYPLASRVYPNVGVTSEEVARAMVHVGLRGTGDNDTIVEHRDIRPMADRHRRTLG